MNTKNIFVILLATLLTFPACLHRVKLPALKPYAKEQQKVHVSAKPLNDAEAYEQFGRRMVKRGYLPIQLNIENKNDTTFILHPWYITLPISSPTSVARDMKHDTAWPVIGLFATWLIGFEWFAPLEWAILAIPPVSGYLYYKNRKIKKEVMRSSIDRGVESIVIPPFGTVMRYIFVATHDFVPGFNLTLFNARDNKPLVFEIDLSAEQIPL